MLTLAKFIRWLFAKFAAGGLIVVLGVAACGLWIYLRDNADLEQWRQETVRAITGKRSELQRALQDVNQQLAELSVQIAAEQGRAKLADKVVADLGHLDSVWDRFFGDREQQRINSERRHKVAAERKAIQAHLAELEERFTHTTWMRDGLEIALGKEDTKLRKVEAQRSKAAEYLQRVWNYEVGRGVLKMPIKTWVLIVLAVYFVGPSAGKLFLYFVLAPWVSRGRPVRLAESVTTLPLVGSSQVAAEISLGGGERLRVREKFLQASDEGLRRRTRYLLDWKIPLTCLAAGLTELIEIANASGHDGGEQRVTLSNQADPHSELAVITIPEGSSLVLRPSFLAGVVTTEDRPLRIRRRWQLWRWQAWVTLQFRFFEFVGPCRLIVAGSRGVRAENLADRAGEGVPARRTNQDATVGFTPNLDYRPVRAETFWSYYRGMNPLFDDLFAGRGIFLCQQVATEGDAKNARKFWSTVWGGAMKVFGL